MFLAVDCTQKEQCEVLLIFEEKIHENAYPVRAQDVLSSIEQSLATHKAKLQDIRGLFVRTGEGSFMAGRISVSAINGLGQSLGVPVIGVGVISDLNYSACQVLLDKVPIDNFAITRYASEPNIRVKES